MQSFFARPSLNIKKGEKQKRDRRWREIQGPVGELGESVGCGPERREDAQPRHIKPNKNSQRMRIRIKERNRKKKEKKKSGCWKREYIRPPAISQSKWQKVYFIFLREEVRGGSQVRQCRDGRRQCRRRRRANRSLFFFSLLTSRLFEIVFQVALFAPNIS